MPGSDSDGSVAVIHKQCGGVAFKVDRRPARYDVMDASSVVWPANTVRTGDYVTCFACGQRMSPADIEIDGGFRDDNKTEETETQ